LEDVTMVGHDVNFAMLKNDGNFEAKPMIHHLCMFKGFFCSTT
jgi:hypothetical protein